MLMVLVQSLPLSFPAFSSPCLLNTSPATVIAIILVSLTVTPFLVHLNVPVFLRSLPQGRQTEDALQRDKSARCSSRSDPALHNSGEARAAVKTQHSQE